MATADQIVNTAVELGELKSWEAVRLHDVAAALSITLNDVHAHFREKEDIVEAWFERADSAMLRMAQAPDFSLLTPHQRLHRLIMTWLASLYPYRKATRQINDLWQAGAGSSARPDSRIDARQPHCSMDAGGCREGCYVSSARVGRKCPHFHLSGDICPLDERQFVRFFQDEPVSGRVPFRR
jgi:AcrR family transcriptional regulator